MNRWNRDLRDTRQDGSDLDRLRALMDVDIARLDETELPSALTGLAAGIAVLAARSFEVAGRLRPESSLRNTHDDLVDVHEAARVLGMSVKWVYRHASKLPFAVRVGRSLRFSRAGIEKYRRAQAA